MTHFSFRSRRVAIAHLCRKTAELSTDERVAIVHLEMEEVAKFNKIQGIGERATGTENDYDVGYQQGRVHGVRALMTLLQELNIAKFQGFSRMPPRVTKKLTASQAKEQGLTAVNEFIAQQPNPWAVCTESVGRKDKAKYERCVQKVKEQSGAK